MKRTAIAITAAACLFSASCITAPQSTDAPVRIILETDIGNDVDDALALGLAYSYLNAGKIDLLAICINKEGSAPGEFTDIMNTYYGHPEIPIGIIKGGADCEDDAVNYAKAVVDKTNEDGVPAFRRSISDFGSLPEAHKLYRKILSEQEDNSVVIVSVGFSTNLIKLLETQGDGYSPLDGKELVSKKVRQLVTMAGNFEDPEAHEYNVWKDIPAAKIIFEQWPTPVVTSPFELGIQTCYPATSIENDFAPLNPIVEAYKSYLPMPYDRPMWDPTALIYAVEGDKWFNVSPPGTITVTDEGSTLFTENGYGDRRYINVNAEQAKAIVDYCVERIPAVPAGEGII